MGLEEANESVQCETEEDTQRPDKSGVIARVQEHYGRAGLSAENSKGEENFKNLRIHLEIFRPV